MHEQALINHTFPQEKPCQVETKKWRCRKWLKKSLLTSKAAWSLAFPVHASLHIEL